MNSSFDYLLNGDMIMSAYTVYDYAFKNLVGFIGLPLGILWIVFQILLYIQVRNMKLNFILGLISFSILFVLIAPIMKAILLTILVFELAFIIYEWVVSD